VVALVCVWMVVVGATASATKKRRVITIRPDPNDAAKCRIDYEKVNISHYQANNQRVLWKGKKKGYVVLFKKANNATLDSPCYVNTKRQFAFDVPEGDESAECYVPNWVDENAVFDYSIYQDGAPASCLDPAVIVTDGGKDLDAKSKKMPKRSLDAVQEEPKITSTTADLVVDINEKCKIDNQAVNLYRTDPDAKTLQWRADKGAFKVTFVNSDACGAAQFTVDAVTGVSGVCTANVAGGPYAYTIVRTDQACPANGSGDVMVGQ
jgi:hypothetical protein